MAIPLEKLSPLAQQIYKIVTAAQGKKQLKAMDIQKTVLKSHQDLLEAGADDRTKKFAVKMAIKDLIDNGHCVYTYFGGSYIEIPHEEGAAKK